MDLCIFKSLFCGIYIKALLCFHFIILKHYYVFTSFGMLNFIRVQPAHSDDLDLERGPPVELP